MKDKIIAKLEGLSESELTEVLRYINYVEYNRRDTFLEKADFLLKYFNNNGFRTTWKSLANDIRNSNIPTTSVTSGIEQMDKAKVAHWLSLEYSINVDIALEAIEVMTDSGLLGLHYDYLVF